MIVAKITKADILARKDTKPKPVAVEAFGSVVHVKAMTGRERDSFEQGILESRKNNQPVNYRGALIARTACNEDGSRMFDDADGEELADLPAADLEPIFEKAQELAKLSGKDQKELEGNS